MNLLPSSRRTLSPGMSGALYNFAFFGTLGAYLPFLNVYFHQLGLNGRQVGLLSALLPAMTLLVTTPLSLIADRRDQRLNMLMFGLAGLSLVLLLLAFSAGFWLLVPLLTLYALCFAPLTSLADSMIAGMAGRHQLNFGDMRLWGSLGFAVASILCGAIWARFGYRPMFVSAGILYVAVIACTFRLEERGGGRSDERVSFRTIRQDTFLTVILFATFLAATAMGMDMTFSGIYMTHVGGSDLSVGLMFGIAAFCELPTMRYSKRLAAFISEPGALLLAYAFYGVAYLGFALSPSPALLLFFSVFRGFGFGLFYVSTVTLIRERTPSEWAATLQGIMNAMAFGLSRLISGPIGGTIYDTLGPSGVYVACFIVSCLGMLVLIGLLYLGSEQTTQAGTRT